MTGFTDYVPKTEQGALEQARRVKQALWISYFSITISIGFGIFFFVASFTEDSSASYGFALSGVLDVISSAIVVWRFFPKKGVTFTLERERLACITLGFLFLLFAGLLLIRSVMELVEDQMPLVSIYLLIGSSVAFVIMVVIVVTKIFLGIKLHSLTLISDAVVSSMEGLAAIALIIEQCFLSSHPDIYVMDPAVGIIIVCGLFFYGLKLLFDMYRWKAPAVTGEPTVDEYHRLKEHHELANKDYNLNPRVPEKKEDDDRYHKIP